MKKPNTKISIFQVIKLAIAYYLYKFGLWLTQLSFSLFIILFVILMLMDKNNDIINIYFPLSLFIIAQIFTGVGAYWSLSNGVDLANTILSNKIH